MINSDLNCAERITDVHDDLSVMGGRQIEIH